MLVVEPGDQPVLGAHEGHRPRWTPAGSYSMTVLLSNATKAELRAAGTAYPPEIAQFYLGTAA